MENIAKFFFKLGSNTRELAKLKSGPLIKEIIERFSEKIDSSLKPDRSLWFYSAHDFTISNVLNSLKLFEVIKRLGFCLEADLFQNLMNDCCPFSATLSTNCSQSAF